MASASATRKESAPQWSDLRYPLLDLVSPKVAASASKVCVFNSGTDAIIITKDDHVYGIGTNDNTCLGMLNYSKVLPPREEKHAALSGKYICQVVASFDGTFVLANTKDGAVYSWGKNGQYGLGNGGDSGLVRSPLVFGVNIRIVQLACGADHALALDGNGQVYAWGKGDYAQIGPELGSKYRPVQVLTNEKVSSVFCGPYCNMVITRKGEVIVWGRNASESLGVENSSCAVRYGYHQRNVDNTLSPRKLGGILQGKKICQIAMGNQYSLMLSDDGVVYGCGNNDKGQLGDCTTNACKTPKAISSQKSSFKEIAAVPNGNSSAGMLNDGRIYIWGQCWGQNILQPSEITTSSIQSCLSSASSVQNTSGTVHLVVTRERSAIEENIATAFQDQTTSDCCFIVDGKRIYAHKAFIKIRCKHLRDKFMHENDSTSNLEIEVPEYRYDVYRAFIEYLYTEKITISPESAVSLLDLANTHQEAQLKEMCVELIKRDLTITNVSAVYASAVKYNANSLQKFCVDFAAQDLRGVCWTTGFASLDKDLMLDLLRKCQPLFTPIRPFNFT